MLHPPIRGFFQLLCAERLEEAIVETGFFQLSDDTGIVGSHRYYLHVTVVGVLNHPDAVHLGHFDIHHHQRRMLVVEHGERLGYMQTGKDLPTVAYQLLQHLLKQAELQRVVIEQQYLVISNGA